MSLFKINYSYKLKILLTPRQAKKTSETVKERIEKLIQLYRNLYKLVQLVNKQAIGSHIIGLYSEVTKIKRPYYRTGI